MDQLGPSRLKPVAFFAQLYGIEAAAEDGLREFGLAGAADMPCQYLSAGQKKLLALASLKLCRRPIWLLDEPLGSLDKEGRGLVVRLIAQHCGSGGIVIAATHEEIAFDGDNLRLGR